MFSLLFPGESFTVQLAPNEKMLPEFSVSYEDIADLYVEHGDARERSKELNLATARPPPPPNWTITLNVSMGDIDNVCMKDICTLHFAHLAAS